ncbi:MAG: DNA repair protein RecN [Clostridia bacterium]|nr:DNA repair protein RecN [Clostridia bacterium]
MLVELSIRNLAIIDAVRIGFAPGFNVLTGETGAGKSIVVDAVNLVLGERADRDMIQAGADKAHVEALFDVTGHVAVLKALEELGLEAEDGFLPLAREISVAGRTLCRVGGSVVPLATLRQVAEALLDMHGQHEHQSLLDVRRHLAYLDAYGDAAHAALVAGVREAYHAWREAAKELAKLRERLQERDARLDLLRYQISELDGARLRAGEEEELERQRVFFRNAEKITEGIEYAFEAIYEGEGEKISALESLRAGTDALAPLGKLDASYQQLYERLEELYYQLEDASAELRTMRDGLEYDPETAEEVEARLDVISRLRRKYGATTHDMLATRDRLAAELAGLEDAEGTEADLERKATRLEAELYDQAQALHLARRALAHRFEERMCAQLADLGMVNATMRAGFSDLPTREDAAGGFSADGLDHIEFLLAPNLGEPERPLARIASGGELSRIMLALKTVSAEKTGVPSMVFDEIDAGISGRMAQVVAEKMAALAKGHQVICVTHLPQIAAMADAQFLVEKRESEGRTRTNVARLDEQGRCAELARIVGGADPQSASSLNHAATLLQEAAERKDLLRRQDML